MKSGTNEPSNELMSGTNEFSGTDEFSSYVYIRTELKFTANPAVCLLSDHVTKIFSRQHRGTLKDGCYRELGLFHG